MASAVSSTIRDLGIRVHRTLTLREQGILASSERVVLLITGSGLKTSDDEVDLRRTTVVSTEPAAFRREVGALLEGAW